MPRFFNTAGPCNPEYHYMLPAGERLPTLQPLLEQQLYFTVHAPRQSGKTTAFIQLARQLTAEGQYAALHVSCETGQAAGRNVELVIAGADLHAVRASQPRGARSGGRDAQGKITVVVVSA